MKFSVDHLGDLYHVFCYLGRGYVLRYFVEVMGGGAENCTGILVQVSYHSNHPRVPSKFSRALVDFSSFLEVSVFYFRVLMVEVDLQPVLSDQPYPVSRA